MDLQPLRLELDSINEQILALYCRRMELVREVAKTKIAHRLPVYHPAREQEIIDSMTEHAGEELSAGAKVLFQTIMDLSRSSQYELIARSEEHKSPLRARIEAQAAANKTLLESCSVACQGVAGAYSGEAANAVFRAPQISFYPQFEDVFRAVAGGECQYGVLPIENSNAGSVGAVYDLMGQYSLFICRSYKLPVSHCLLGVPGSSLSQVRDVYSHEQALSQCAPFFEAHPNINTHVYSNTAAAARFVLEKNECSHAAVASRACAELYSLDCLQERLQGEGVNFTRFIVVSREMVIEPQACRIGLSLRLPHQPGSLYRLITRFAVLDLNLTKLESRPVPDSDFQFLFYFELEGSVRREAVLDLICSLSQELEGFQFLGNYREGGCC